MSPRLDGYRGINVYEQTYRTLKRISRESGMPLTKVVAALVDDYMKPAPDGPKEQP
jgi:hypothetical protein